MVKAYKEGDAPQETLSWNDAVDKNAFHSTAIVMDFNHTSNQAICEIDRMAEAARILYAEVEEVRCAAEVLVILANHRVGAELQAAPIHEGGRPPKPRAPAQEAGRYRDHLFWAHTAIQRPNLGSRFGLAPPGLLTPTPRRPIDAKADFWAVQPLKLQPLSGGHGSELRCRLRPKSPESLGSLWGGPSCEGSRAMDIGAVCEKGALQSAPSHTPAHRITFTVCASLLSLSTYRKGETFAVRGAKPRVVGATPADRGSG
jgi:hypothetical protein